MTRPSSADPFAPTDTPDADPWALTPATTQIGAHLYELRTWLPAGQQVGAHLVDRCCKKEETP